MNRRNFMSLFASVPVVAMVPSLIEVPKRTIFLPPKGGWAVGRCIDIDETGIWITNSEVSDWEFLAGNSLPWFRHMALPPGQFYTLEFPSPGERG
jgi:hypothetical protein